MKVMEFSNLTWCETIAASGRYHLRILSDRGRKVSGGSDTKTLCGLQPSWDITESYPVNKETILANPHYGWPCRECVGKLDL